MYLPVPGFPGVRYREHKTRKVVKGAIKVLDRYYVIRYTANYKPVEQALGWASEGWTPEKASSKRAEYMSAAKSGEGAKSPQEERALKAAEAKAKQEEQQRLEEEERKRQAAKVTAKSYFYNSYFPECQTTKKKTRRSHRQSTDETHFRLWLDPILGEKELGQIEAADLRKVRTRMQEAGKSPRTIEYVFATFRQMWNMAITDNKVFKICPTKEVKVKKVDNKRTRFLTAEEAEALLGEIEKIDIALYRMCVISLYTGMRAGEIFELTWRDVDLEQGFIRIVDPKNGLTRYAHITSPVRGIIEELPKGRSTDFLFLNTKGEPFTEAPKTFKKVVLALGFNDGIEDRRDKVVFHSLRHTFGAWLAANNVTLYKISKLLGHKTLSMTERYAHLTTKTLQEAVKTLEAVAAEIGEIKALADRLAD